MDEIKISFLYSYYFFHFDFPVYKNLLINKIIDVFKNLDSNGKTLGKKMIISSLKRDSDKYNVSQDNSIEKTIKDLKEQLL